MKRRGFLSAGTLALLLPGLAAAGAGAVDLHGAVIFRRGRAFDLVTQTILLFSPVRPARWSHVGVVVRMARGRLWVAHAMPDAGVFLEPLEAFEAAGTAWDIVPQIDPQAGALVASAALADVGKRFDDYLRASESDTLYCTEHVFRALAAAGIAPVFERITAPGYSEPIMHPDSLFDALQRG